MLHIKLIVTGSLKEPYWREACAEYEKRLSSYAKIDIVERKEWRLSENPSPMEVETALEKEADAILSAIPPRAYTVALCVEGTQLTSVEWAQKIGSVMQSTGELCLIIGSSFGLSPRVKAAAAFRLSVSKLTFPHQLMRVLLLETTYRALSILNGGKYHK